MSRRQGNAPSTDEEMVQFLLETAQTHPVVLEEMMKGNQLPLMRLLESKWPTTGKNPVGVDWLESRTARHEMAMCRSEKCHYSKAQGAKLFACSGCKMARYCSRECQAHDWPAHKIICRRNQQAKKDLQKAIADRSATTRSPPPITDANGLFNDLQSFKRRMAPAINVACINAFMENSPRPGFVHGIDERVFVLRVDSLPQNLIKPKQPAWMRFQFRSVSLELVDDIFEVGTQFREERNFVFEGDDPEQHGNLSCIILCPSFGCQFSYVSTLIRVQKRTRMDGSVAVVDDWKEMMATQVEKLTGNKRSPLKGSPIML
ncbi:hypothetical protein QCA50_014839 [Cerrena zonata]|uniref:MYND-type domain-containing protein n=1 Tax=Cerrena zonata TaxID=2478898 RepID=A0AAW0FQ68_9APHY